MSAPAAEHRGPVGRLLARILSDETLTQKATLNMVASFLDYGARIVVGFLLNPILVSRLGDSVFGVYQVLGRLIGYATPAGGRPSQALKWTLAHHQHSTDYEEKRRQVGSALTVWFIFLPPLAIAAGILGWFAPVWLNVPDNLTTTVRLAAALLAADLIVTNLATIPQSVLQGENLGYKRMGLSTVLVVAGGGLTALVVVLGGGLVGVAASVVATTAVTGLLFVWVAERNVDWFGMERMSVRAVFPFMRLSGWFLLWNLVMQVMRGSDVVVLGIAGSTELVAVYVLARYVPEAIFGGVAIVVSGVMPGLGGLIGARQGERAARIRSESMSMTWLIATAVGAVYLLFGEAFLRLWVGESYYPGQLASFLIIVMVLQFALIRNDAAIIDLTLDLRAKVLLGFLSAAIAVGLGIVFVQALDEKITGLALGFIVGRAVQSVAYPWLVGRAFGISARRQVVGVVRPGIVTAVLYVGAVLLVPEAGTSSWLVLTLASGVALVVVGVASFFGGLSPKQRRRLRERFAQMLGRA
jgi:O-antigen/teichoic acid export membrane protein